MLRGNRACRTCYEDATKKLLPWNLAYTDRALNCFRAVRRAVKKSWICEKSDVLPVVRGRQLATEYV